MENDRKKIKKSHAFKVIMYKSKHYYMEKYKQERDKHVSYKYIADKIKINFKDTSRKLKPKDIINDIKNETGLDVIYRKAFMVKKQAIKIVRGSIKDSFWELISFLYMLEK